MNYIAYTIGPIYETIFRTLNDDNKTRRLKAGSYFFSYFMKKLLVELKPQVEVLVPYVGDYVLEKEHKVGLFHDRLIARSERDSQELSRIFENALESVYAQLAEETGNGCEAQGFADAMDNHLLITSEEELKRIDENIIFAINRVLDSMELQRTMVEDQTNCIEAYQDKRVQERKGRVRTLEEIGKEMGYYAVITADGDNMGEKIRTLATEDPAGIETLSHKLSRFFVEDEGVYTLTQETFGGELIYAGGDDILAFVPVKYAQRSFLEYAKALSERFEDYLGEEVSLSFGINIVFYKYPLRDAIQGAFKLLYEAKSELGATMALEVTKHSGQRMRTVHHLRSERYGMYARMVEAFVAEEKMRLPHAFHHSLSRYKDAVVSLYAAPSNASLRALFDTVYNDRREEAEERGLALVHDYIELCAPATPEAFERLFYDLGIIKFLREDRA